jgi:hypothetical protein
MKNISDKSCRETQNTHFIFNNIFQKIVPFMRKWKNFVERGWPHDNMAQAHCMLDT